MVDEWVQVHRQRVASDTLNHYRHAVRTLFPEGSPFPRSRFTVATLEAWLAGIEGASGTRRKYHAAMSQLAKYLVRRGVLAFNPMRDLQAPRPSAPRCRWLDVPGMIRLAGEQREPYQTLSALLGGSGI